METLSPEQISALLDELEDIPTLPSVATAIMEKTLEANINAQQIAEMVEKDQALSLKVLRVANSPFYRRIKEISTVRGAVVLLGLNVLKSIVLSISVVNLFDESKKNTLDLYRFWQHSIACAVCARAVAAKVTPAVAEDAFMAGLLHDLGKVVMDQSLCRRGEYQQILEKMQRPNADIITVEQQMLGIDHATIGRHLMERWNLPSFLCQTVGAHHSLQGVDAETARLCAIIHVADTMVNHLGLGLCETGAGYLDPALLRQLDLSSHDVQDISLIIKDQIAAISEELGIPQAEPKTYFEVLQSANAQLGGLSLDLEQKKQALERRTVELSQLNQMSSALQSSLKLSEITAIIASHMLTILEGDKARCMMRLSQMRIMVTEGFWVSNTVQTRTGITGGTKELMERTSGLTPREAPYIHAPLRVDDRIIGVLECVPARELSPEERAQRGLLLRTIADVAAQAIHRAMLITRNIKNERLAAVSKTAIAANHEINSPLTTMLLNLDMLLKNTALPPEAAHNIEGIKDQALKIKLLVKKMLEISEVVETSYTRDETMIDLHQPARQPAPAAPAATTTEEKPPADLPGFEDYLDE